MAKHPAPGRVKTRLAATLGRARACALYEAFLLDLAERLERAPYDVTWVYWPPGAPFRTLLPGRDCRPQRGVDLGARMARALGEVLTEGVGSAIVLGVDAPHVPLARLDEAAAQLGIGVDLVVGPAADGGYYLLGMRTLHPKLFAGIPWGTASVLNLTLARAHQLGLRTHLLAEEFDIDEAVDVTRLEGLLREGRVYLPRTAAVLAQSTDRA